MRIAASLTLFVLLTPIQYCYAFKIDELIKTSRVNEMQLTVSGGKASGLIYFDKVDRFGYCLTEHIEVDGVSLKKDITPIKFIAFKSCNNAVRSDFNVEFKGINKSSEKAAISILKEVVSCSSVKCFEKNSGIILPAGLLPIYPSEITLDKNEFVVRAAMPHMDKDYYFYFTVEGGRLTIVNAVDSFAPDDASVN